MKTAELIDYLKKYPADSQVSILVADSEARLLYPVKNQGGITDQEIPIIILDVGKPEPMEGGEG